MLIVKFHKRTQPTASVTPSMEEQQLYTALLTKVLGDRGKAARLIAFERERMPKGTRLDWLRDANERRERDNR
jgi:hypothetical protein